MTLDLDTFDRHRPARRCRDTAGAAGLASRAPARFLSARRGVAGVDSPCPPRRAGVGDRRGRHGDAGVAPLRQSPVRRLRRRSGRHRRGGPHRLPGSAARPGRPGPRRPLRGAVPGGVSAGYALRQQAGEYTSVDNVDHITGPRTPTVPYGHPDLLVQRAVGLGILDREDDSPTSTSASGGGRSNRSPPASASPSTRCACGWDVSTPASPTPSPEGCSPA